MLFEARRGGFKEKIQKYLKAHSDTLLFILVIGIGLSAAGVSFFSLRSAIYSPFAPRDGQTVVAANTILQKDTDGDGLYDNDELTVYETSPYLKDTDSDTISDADEITQGKNPNCPEGETCAITTSPSTSPSTTTQTTTVPSGIPQSADELRKSLREAGVSEEVLNSLSDEQLLAEYQQALSSISSQSANNSSSTTVSSVTAAQVRAVLKQNGVTDEQLAELSDEELLELYRQSSQEVAGANR